MNKYVKYLIISFIVLTIIKIIISFLYDTPWIYYDEYTYAYNAKELLNNPLMIGGKIPNIPQASYYQTGYSYVLTPAYLLTNNPYISYRIILVINCILTSLIIFPIYYLARQFLDKKISYLAGIIVATIPTLVIINYNILSENLFYILYIINALLLVLYIQKPSYKTLLFILITLGLSIFTRPLGIAMIITTILILGVKTIKTYYKAILPLNYSFVPYIQNLPNLWVHPILALQIFANMTSYYILNTYLLFFIFTIYLLLCWKKLKKTTKILLTYNLLNTIMLMGITILHILPTHYIYTRYISPTLPLFFITGILGLHTYIHNPHRDKLDTIIIISIATTILPVSFLNIPSLKHINNLDFIGWYAVGKIPIFLIILLIIAVVIVLIIVVNIKKLNKNKMAILVVLISSMVVFPSIVFLQQENMVIKEFNQPAHYLQRQNAEYIYVEKTPWIYDNLTSNYKRGYLYTDLVFWNPNSEVEFINSSNLDDSYILDKTFFVENINTTIYILKRDKDDKTYMVVFNPINANN